MLCELAVHSESGVQVVQGVELFTEVPPEPWWAPCVPSLRAATEEDARAFKVLQVAAHRGHRTLVLGAWGCGVFRNDPTEVAKAFSAALGALPGAFARVVFAVYERGGDGPNLRAFRDRFGPYSA